MVAGPVEDLLFDSLTYLSSCPYLDCDGGGQLTLCTRSFQVTIAMNIWASSSPNMKKKATNGYVRDRLSFWDWELGISLHEMSRFGIRLVYRSQASQRRRKFKSHIPRTKLQIIFGFKSASS